MLSFLRVAAVRPISDSPARPSASRPARSRIRSLLLRNWHEVFNFEITGPPQGGPFFYPRLECDGMNGKVHCPLARAPSEGAERSGGLEEAENHGQSGLERRPARRWKLPVRGRARHVVRLTQGGLWLDQPDRTPG